MAISKSWLCVLVFFSFMTALPAGASKKQIWWYTSVYKEFATPLAKAFEAKHPDTEVEVFQGGSEKIQSKFEAELLAKKPQADFMMISDPFYGHELQKRGLVFQKTSKPEPDTNYYSLMVLICHRDLPVDKRPVAFNDLTKPEFKDMIQMGSPLESGTMFAAVAYLSDKYGWDYFKKLRDNNMASSGGNSTVLQKVESGERKIGMVLLENALAAKKRGTPIEIIYPSDGSIPIPSVQLVSKDSPQKEIASEFADFVLSKDGQMILREGFMYSVRNDVPAPEGAKPLKEVTKKATPWTPARVAKVAESLKKYKKAIQSDRLAVAKMILWLYVLLISLIFISPLGGLISQIQGAASLETLRDPGFVKSLNVTLVSSVCGAMASVIMGILLARQFAHHQWRGKRLQRLALLFPYLIPNFILAIGFVIAWNPRTGLLNFLVKFPFGLYGLSGLTFLFSIVHMPVSFLLFEDKMKRIDSSLREAARLSGASSWQVFLNIELPLLRPTVLSAVGLCFALNISAFAIPAWISAPQKIYPLTYKIYQAIQLGGLDGLPEAATLSLILFALALIPLFITHWAQGNTKRYAVLSGKSAKISNEIQSSFGFFGFQVIFLFIQLIFWIAPLGCLFFSTIVKPGCLQSDGLKCFGDISFHSYKYVLFDLEDARSALHGSLIYGSLSALIIVGISILSLALLSQNMGRLRIVEGIFSILLSTPGAIIALGLIVVASGRFGINLYNTPWIVVAAYVLKHTSLAFQPLRTGLTNISSSLLEAARLSGAGPLNVWRKIVIPILQPEFLGGFFLVLIPILGELTMSIFLTSPSFKSIGTVLFDLQDYADQASAGALAILLVFLILILNELSRWLSRGKLGY